MAVLRYVEKRERWKKRVIFFFLSFLLFLSSSFVFFSLFCFLPFSLSLFLLEESKQKQRDTEIRSPLRSFPASTTKKTLLKKNAGSPDLPEDERPPIPFVPELEDPKWKAVYGSIEMDCEHHDVFQNAIDVAHIHYLVRAEGEREREKEREGKFFFF